MNPSTKQTSRIATGTTDGDKGTNAKGMLQAIASAVASAVPLFFQKEKLGTAGHNFAIVSAVALLMFVSMALLIPPGLLVFSSLSILVILIIVMIWVEFARRSESGQPSGASKARAGKIVIRLTLLVIVLVTAPVVLSRTPGGERFLPPAVLKVLNPKRMPVLEVESYIRSLNEFLAAPVGSECSAFAGLAGHFSDQWLDNRGWQSKSVRAYNDGVASSQQVSDLSDVARRVRSQYGKAASVQRLTAELVEWEPQVKVHVASKFAGQFIPNRMGMTSRVNRGATVLDMASLSDPNVKSEFARTVSAWVGETFGAEAGAAVNDRFTTLPVSTLLADNAADLIWDRLSAESGAELARPLSSAYVYGTEFTYSSLRLVWSDSYFRWQIAEIGPWLTRRDLPDVRSQPEPRVAAVDNVVLSPQQDSSSCQAAALEMLFNTMTKSKIDGGQAKIRESLGQDPTAHSARVQWANGHLGFRYTWSMRYDQSIEVAASAIVAQLERGIPVVLSTRLTESGHVVLVTGIELRDKRFWLRCMDPWGVFNPKTLRYENTLEGGDNVWYPMELLSVSNRTWRRGMRSRLQRYIVPTDTWLPSSSSLLEEGWEYEGLVTDWEWLSARRR